MGAILIKADTESNKILSALAQKLGGTVINIDEEKYEDLAIGSVMDDVKTGKTIETDEIIQKLSSNEN